MQLINTIFISLLPTFNSLASCLICVGMGVYVLFFILAHSLLFAFRATDLLKWSRDKNLIANKTFAVFPRLDRVFVLLKNINRMMTCHAQSNKIIHAIILAYSCRDFMMHIKRPTVLFRSFPALLTNFIPVTNGLCNFQPSVTIINMPPSIVPMVLSNQPLIHVISVYKKQVSLFSLHAVVRMFHCFPTATCTSNQGTRFTISLTEAGLCLHRMLATIEGIIFTNFERFLTFLRKTCCLCLSFIWSTFKYITADDTVFRYAWDFVGNHNENPFKFFIFEPIHIIQQIGVFCKYLGYDPDEEAILLQKEQALNTTQQPATPEPQQQGGMHE